MNAFIILYEDNPEIYGIQWPKSTKLSSLVTCIKYYPIGVKIWGQCCQHQWIIQQIQWLRVQISASDSIRNLKERDD